MKMPLEKSLTRPLLILGAAGFAIFFFLYSQYAVEFAFRPEIARERAQAIADSLLRSAGYDLRMFSSVLSLSGDTEESTARQLAAGRRRTRGGRKDAAFTWQVRYSQKDRTSIHIQQSAALPRENESSVTVRLRTDGTLHELTAFLADTLRTRPLEASEALLRAEGFLRRTHRGSADSLVETSVQQRGNRTDRIFTWRGTGLSGEREKITIGFSGDILTTYAEKEQKEERVAQILNMYEMLSILSVVGGIVLVILILVTLVRRLRNDEIGFRSAIFWGIVTTAALAVSYGIRFSEEDFAFSSWMFYFIVFITSVFRGIVMIFSWSASEGIGRSQWNEKFLTLDAVQRFAFRSRWIGVSLLQGIGAGGILLGCYALFHPLLSLFPEHVMFLGSMSDQSGSAAFLETPLKNAGSLLDLVATSVTAALVLSVFAPGLARRFTERKLLLVATGGICWMAMTQTLFHAYHPLYLHLAFTFAAGAAVTWLFLLTDLQAVLVALLTVNLSHHALVALHRLSDGFLPLGIVYLGILLLILGAGIFLSTVRREEVDLADYTPHFVKRMAERHRLQQEVESARHIQQSLLPREIPRIVQLDIAAACFPALEVGGDYYDFIGFDDHTVGALIGDVSGKGISAAFYMTLAKGVIASQARRSPSPRAVLSSVNELLYEIMERGKFISMVYGVFDTAAGSLTYAHAGHNPIIHFCARDGELRILRSPGMALGLEKGVKFSETLTEERIPLEPGDIFIFYTDGYVEAMDKHMVEFGEERLLAAIRSNTGRTASEMLSSLTAAAREYMGKTRQHDDMTMVVVRVEAPGATRIDS